MSIFNRSEPLGLPRGSVRALLTLMIAGVFCYRFAIGLVIDPTLSFAFGTVLIFYFNKRSDESSEPVEEIVPEPEF